YDRIKTFGVGRDITSVEWEDYIFQLLNSGFVDIAYDDAYSLKLNDLSRKILQAQMDVLLTKPVQFEKKLETIAAVPRKQAVADELFERLRALRKALADENNVPAYVVFSDKTLLEMAAVRPRDAIEMLGINGVGEHKLSLYGEEFLHEIRLYANKY
ncbi:MAG: HRDC domain-containing protein, partial [Smithellaceae bacterium]